LRVRNSRYDPGTAAEHPPHSWAHRDFTARRLIRDVFAVRERLSDPRVVPSFRCTFLPDMPPSPTPGSRRHIVQVHDADMVFANGARHSPIPPQSVSRGRSFRGCTGSQLLRPVRLLASPDGSDRNTLPATGGFYVQAFDGAVTLTVAGYDYDIDWTPMSAGLPPAGMAASFAARSHRTWRADFPHHALRQLVHSFHCYLFKFRFHGRLIFSLNRRP
jgi:hypothetical protein